MASAIESVGEKNRVRISRARGSFSLEQINVSSLFSRATVSIPMLGIRKSTTADTTGTTWNVPDTTQLGNWPPLDASLVIGCRDETTKTWLTKNKRADDKKQ